MPFIYDRLSLEGKVAIVTGGGQGIGKAVVLGLAEVGAKVVIAEMNEETGPKTEREVKDSGKEALYVKADVREPEQVDKLMESVMSAWGRIDVMVNNAGGVFFAPAVDISPNGFDAVIRQNLKTMFLCSQAAAKEMIKGGRGGSIIGLASVDAYLGSHNHAHYGAAKAGVVGLTKAFATEWGEHGIRVNAVAPGIIDTEGTRAFGRDRPRDVSQIPLQQGGEPEDIAGGVVFLASDLARYVTGETLLVDGSLVIRGPSARRQDR